MNLLKNPMVKKIIIALVVCIAGYFGYNLVTDDKVDPVVVEEVETKIEPKTAEPKVEAVIEATPKVEEVK